MHQSCRRRSSVGLGRLGHWLASGSAVKSLSRLTEPPGQQMFHQPGGRMSRKLHAASGYRAPLFWKGFVLKNTTPEITRRPAAASIWKDQPSGRDGGGGWLSKEEKAARVYLGLRCISNGENLLLALLDFTLDCCKECFSTRTPHTTGVRNYNESWITQSVLSN